MPSAIHLSTGALAQLRGLVHEEMYRPKVRDDRRIRQPWLHQRDAFLGRLTTALTARSGTTPGSGTVQPLQLIGGKYQAITGATETCYNASTTAAESGKRVYCIQDADGYYWAVAESCDSSPPPGTVCTHCTGTWTTTAWIDVPDWPGRNANCCNFFGKHVMGTDCAVNPVLCHCYFFTPRITCSTGSYYMTLSLAKPSVNYILTADIVVDSFFGRAGWTYQKNLGSAKPACASLVNTDHTLTRSFLFTGFPWVCGGFPPTVTARFFT